MTIEIICKKNRLQEKLFATKSFARKSFAGKTICKKNHLQEKPFARKIICKKNHLQEKSFARKIISTIFNGKTIQHSTMVCDGNRKPFNEKVKFVRINGMQFHGT
jgi:hypothetical protein